MGFINLQEKLENGISRKDKQSQPAHLATGLKHMVRKAQIFCLGTKIKKKLNKKTSRILVASQEFISDLGCTIDLVDNGVRIHKNHLFLEGKKNLKKIFPLCFDFIK